MQTNIEELRSFLASNLPNASRIGLNPDKKGRLTIIPNSETESRERREAIKVYPPRKPDQDITWTAKTKAGKSLVHKPSRDLLATSHLFSILLGCTGTNNFDRVQTDYPETGQVTLMGRNPVERLIFTINNDPDSRTLHGLLALVNETIK